MADWKHSAFGNKMGPESDGLLIILIFYLCDSWTTLRLVSE